MALVENEILEITQEQIASEGLSVLDDKYQKSVGFFAWDYFIALGKIIYDLWQKVIYIAKCLIDLSNMEYDDLINSKGLGLGQAPIGAYCTVVGATAKEISIQIFGLRIKSGADILEVKTNIETSVKSYFKSLVFDEDISYVSYAKIGALIINTENVFDYDSFLLNGTNDNIVLIDDNQTTEIPILTVLEV